MNLLKGHWSSWLVIYQLLRDCNNERELNIPHGSHLILTTAWDNGAVIILISDLHMFSALPKVTELVKQSTESYYPIDLCF